MANGLFRHLSDAQDTMWVRAITIALIFSWWIIENLISEADFESIVEIVRAYSAEVEYSQKNLDKLFSFAYKFIKL